MTAVKILVWKMAEANGDPDVEIRIPSAVAKWVPRLMSFVPRKTRDEMWGGDVDFKALFENVEELVAEAAAKGISEIADVKTKDGRMKITLENA